MRIRVVISTVLLLLVACGIPRTPEALDKTAEAVFLRHVVDRLSARDFTGIEALLDPQLVVPDVRATLERTADALPREAIIGVTPVAWNVFVSTNAPRQVNISVEYSYPAARWLVISAIFAGEPGSFRIRKFTIQPNKAPLSQIHAFTFKGKGIAQYAFFLATIAAFAISLYACARCLRTKNLRRKWLWAIFTLFGFCAFSLDWTSGAFSMNPLSFLLFSAGFERAGWVGPWTCAFAIPVGALVFLRKHRHMVAAEPPRVEQ